MIGDTIRFGLFAPPVILLGVYIHTTIKDLREQNREAGRTIAHATNGIYYSNKTTTD
jgi:hypothetical protein